MKASEILKKIPKKKGKPKMCLVSGTVTQNHHQILNQYCKLHNITMSALVREIIVHFIENAEHQEE